MVESHDRLEQSLDRLAPASASRAPEPPAAFLKAVGRRRAQRRVRHASVVLCAVALVGIGTLALRLDRTPGPLDHAGPIADAMPFTIGSVHERMAAAKVVPASTVSERSVPAVFAADWRNEAKLAALVGSS